MMSIRPTIPWIIGASSSDGRQNRAIPLRPLGWPPEVAEPLAEVRCQSGSTARESPAEGPDKSGVLPAVAPAHRKRPRRRSTGRRIIGPGGCCRRDSRRTNVSDPGNHARKAPGSPLQAAENGLEIRLAWCLPAETIAALEAAVGHNRPNKSPLLAQLPPGTRYEEVQIPEMPIFLIVPEVVTVGWVNKQTACCGEIERDPEFTAQQAVVGGMDFGCGPPVANPTLPQPCPTLQSRLRFGLVPST